MTASLRPIAAPFVAAAPAGTRVRARLRVSVEDEAVLRAAGAHLGSLAGRDLAARCAEGRLDAAGRARSRAARKRALTAASSSRWAGAITRTSEDQVGLARLAGHRCRPRLPSRWGAEHWLRPLREHHPEATGHHAAALVIGRRGLGHRARRRVTGNQTAPAEAVRPAQARARTTPAHRTAPRKPAAPPGPGSHPAPRPDGLAGPRQATRQPTTVRGRRLDRTVSC